jgi:photosystem II stability/assembly factor-like uncharacterized protein
MRPFLLIILAAFAGCPTVTAQPDIFAIMERTDISLQEVETLAQRYFAAVGTGQGTGYKQYQRWLYERKFHVDENGFFIPPQTEWNNFVSSYATLRPNKPYAAAWTELGPTTWNRTTSWNPGTGRLSAFAIHPANQLVIYVGSPGGGLWKTTNGGGNWQPLSDQNNLWMSIFSLAIDPLDPNIVYAGTSGANLVLKSLDAGITWNALGSGPTGTIRKILIHPTSPSIVFVCATNGIFRSTTGGATWSQVHSSSKEDIEFKPDDVNIMYATGNDVVRSSDNGVTWSQIGSAGGITNSGRTLVAVTPANPDYVYIVQASGSLFGRMYKSTNAGLSFTTTVIGNPANGTNYFGYQSDGRGTTGQATYDMALDVSPTNASEVYIGGIICWVSSNEGVTFTALTEWSFPNTRGYNHADVHGLFWVGSNLYSISDGGIFKSTDQGDNWIDLSAGLGIRQFYRIACSQTNPLVLTGGAQDNGSVARQASGVWADWLGADGMEGLVSPTNHLNLWGTSQNGSLYRSTNGGVSYSSLSRPSAGQWVTPLAIHPTDETILYGGWTGVYKSTNRGSNWTNISGTTISSTLADLALAPSNPNYLYASNGSTLYVTTNDGATWTVRSAPSTINDIAVDPTNPAKIWIACNSSSNRVFVSSDAGATFTNISANLPAIVARTIAIDDKTPRGIYVGMNIGVYFKEESATNWMAYMNNLPLVAINELDIQRSSGKIRVATYGRGVWETDLAPLPVHIVSFTARAIGSRSVRLDWTTLSEHNNYGFYVQRKRENDPAWNELENSFIPGHGTTNEPHYYSFIDSTLPQDGRWLYRLRQVDFDGTEHFTEAISVMITTSVADGIIPSSFRLEQNHPNPFNPSTTITYDLPTASRVKLTVFDALGQELAVLVDEEQPAGRFSVDFSTASAKKEMSSGVYYYRIEVHQTEGERRGDPSTGSGQSFVQTKKLILLK